MGLEKDGKQVNKNISERGKCYQENKTRMNQNAIIIRGRDPRRYAEQSKVQNGLSSVMPVVPKM